VTIIALLAIASCGGPGSPGRGEGSPGAEEGAETGEEQPGGETGTAEPLPPGQREVLVLFPSGADDLLHAQRRVIFWTSAVTDRAKQVVGALIEGPIGGSLPILPAGTQIRELYLLDDGTAFVDFPREILGGPGGSTSELLTVYAIVDSLALNFSEIHRVGILVEGEEVETLSGHLDLRYPLEPDPSFLDPPLARKLQTAQAAPATAVGA